MNFIIAVVVIGAFIGGFYFGKREKNEKLNIHINSHMDLVELVKKGELREEDQRKLAELVLQGGFVGASYMSNHKEFKNNHRRWMDRGDKHIIKQDEMEFKEFLDDLVYRYRGNSRIFANTENL